MKIVVAPDSFKESLSATAVAKNIAIGIRKILPEATIVEIPISDGGEGLLEALIQPIDGTLKSVNVKDPLMRNITTHYGVLKDGKTAIIEMAMASGMELLNDDEKNPMVTSTFGTGLLIKDVLDQGYTKIIIGLGGSATNDGGMGMIKALGGKFLDEYRNPIGEGGGAIAKLKHIDISNLDKRLSNCKIIAACDVSNPLTGPQGASLIFGGQKGANKEQQLQLDKNLVVYAQKIKSDLGIEVNTVPGAGAGGGMGAAIAGFFNGKLVPGIDLIMDTLNLEQQIKDADWVITGEGKIDHQTINGKTVSGIAKMASKYHIPVIAIAGKVEHNLEELYSTGVTATFSIVNQPMSLHEAMVNTDILIQACIENVFRVIIK